MYVYQNVYVHLRLRQAEVNDDGCRAPDADYVRPHPNPTWNAPVVPGLRAAAKSLNSYEMNLHNLCGFCAPNFGSLPDAFSLVSTALYGGTSRT